jgi:sulfhydrogenase subunit delta
MENESPKPKVGIFGLTGCAGDQLQILNCEEELLRLATRLDIVDWVMVRSSNDHTCRLDVAFVEGVVATERDLQTLKEIRARARTLVALGTCAVWGGLPAMRNDIPRETLGREVYQTDTPFLDTVEALPPTHFVPFEHTLPGCPMERHEFLKLVNALLAGTRAELPRSGCGARCPSHGVSCAGCRGPVEEPNYDANVTMFADRGISWVEIARKMEQFSAPVWIKQGLELEVRRGREK